jgi:thimet oligopeptidase
MLDIAFASARLLVAIALAALLGGASNGPAAAAGLMEPGLRAGALSPAALASSCGTQIGRARARIDALVRRPGARTFANTIEALENIESDLNDALAAQQFLFSVARSASVRTASEKCGADVNNLFTVETARPDLYAALVAARASATAATPAQRKLQELYLTGARRAGAGLAATQRREFIALQRKLTALGNAFAANLANDSTTITITPDQIASLPADFAATLKPAASGGSIVPVNESTYSRFLSSESDDAARKAFYIAYFRRGGQRNVDLLQQAIVARDRVAVLLRYPNWSAYIAADRMAGTPARIATFLHDLDVALLPKARQQRAELAAAKASAFEQWDVAYYQNQLKKSRYSVDRDEIKAYFPAPHVIAAVLQIYAHLLGIRFTPAPNLPRWDPAVLAYNVNDTKTGAFRGSFYLDLYPRPGKFSHFANIPLFARRILPNGTIRPALNSIVGNWPAAPVGKPALLSHDDVLTFFHEFGHNVAALLADTPYETLNSGFRWDFVEAPSQMLENFVWNPAILKQISSNVETGQPLPDALIAKMIAARYFDEAYSTVIQDFYATVDQRYHTLPPPVATTAVWKRTLHELTPNDFVEGTLPQAGFGHLMNGYEAQYYGYLWSKVYAQDMFTAFKVGGLENPAVGMRYRNDILAPARSIEPALEVRHFLGRPMDPRTFYHELGITGRP